MTAPKPKVARGRRRLHLNRSGATGPKTVIRSGSYIGMLKRQKMTKLARIAADDALEAEIQRQIASDPDAPEITDEQASQRMSFAEAFPELNESIKRSRGRPAIENAKQPISLRLSPDVIEAFKATGKGWQTRIDEALRKAIGL